MLSTAQVYWILCNKSNCLHENVQNSKNTAVTVDSEDGISFGVFFLIFSQQL